ncbi:MAG: hypothetical protein KBB94_10400, partial [Legionellaceae bacterium]|nr:hypothetical protein [Legionellaceae bacterium]
YPESYRLTLKPATIPCFGCRVQKTSIDYLWDVIRLPLLFQASVETLEQSGPYHYLDLGPFGTLANFVKYNLKPGSLSKTLLMLTPFGSKLNQTSLLI